MNLKIRTLILVLAFVLASPSAQAVELKSLKWNELVNLDSQSFEDPYRDLTEDQIDQLRTVFQFREKIARGGMSSEEKEKLEKLLASAEDAIKAAGLDADWLISQRWVVAGRREEAANAGNPALDKQHVRIAGFAIPAPPDSDGTPAAYLVELRGMCSHMPTPPPNQLIKVRLLNGWVPRYTHQPIRIEGKLHNDPSQQLLRVVDGYVVMKSTWQLDAIIVEDYRPSPLNNRLSLQPSKPKRDAYVENH